MEGNVPYEAFLLKMLFTAVALGGGFKGGEIVPTLAVGATMGAAFGNFLGFEPSLCAACGMLALFAGVTNCPVATIFMGFELFGFEGMKYFALAVSVSFALSGYYGLYSSQKFTYSKTRTEFLQPEGPLAFRSRGLQGSGHFPGKPSIFLENILQYSENTV